MKHILIYSDSLTWGIIPDTRQRLSFYQRWPGVFERALTNDGHDIRVVENCLNGRRTAWSDAIKAGRDGSQGLAQVIEMHSPLALVIIMLGTNDFQSMHNNDAYLSAQGVAKLIQIIRQAPVEPGMPIPDIMIVSPPGFTEPKGLIAKKFIGIVEKSLGLERELKTVAEQFKTHFFDAATVTSTSVVDGIHLDENQHLILGEALAKWVSAKI